jgi:hypothetical protein
MRTLGKRLGNKWVPFMRGALVGALSVLALLVPRWLRKTSKLQAKKTTTLELDLSDLLPADPPPPPSSARISAVSVTGSRASLAPPDVHSFEVH